MKRINIIIAAGLLALGMSTASAQDDAVSMHELLNLIEQGQARDNQEARTREAQFNQQRNQQQQLLNRRAQSGLGRKTKAHVLSSCSKTIRRRLSRHELHWTSVSAH